MNALQLVAPARHLFGAAATVLLAACDMPGPPSPTTIVASDGEVFFPSLRIASESAQSERAPSDVGRGGAFEFNYFHGKGGDTQNVNASDQPIKFGGVNFRGPQHVQHDFTLNWYEVNARGRIFSAEPDRVLGLDFLVGGAFPRLGFRVSTPTQQAAESFGKFGLTTGVGALLRVRPGTSVQGRYTYYRGLGEQDDLQNATRGELYVAQSLTRNVIVRAGYTDWSIHVARGSPNASDINLKMRGPSLGLEAVF
jgi:hypothetical protein